MDTVLLPFEISLKVAYPWGAKDDQMITRRVRLSCPTYDRMKETVKELGGEEDPCVTYTDNENDTVVIGSALEWYECIRLFAATTAGTIKLVLSRPKARLPKPSISYQHVTIDDRWDDIIEVLQREGVQFPPVTGQPMSVSWINVRDGCLHISRKKLKELMNGEQISTTTTTATKEDPPSAVTTGSQITEFVVEVGTGTDIPSTCTTATSTANAVSTIGSQISQPCAEIAVGTQSPFLTETGSCTTKPYSTTTIGSQVTQPCVEIAVGTQSPSLTETGSCTNKTQCSDTACGTTIGEGSHDAGVGPDAKDAKDASVGVQVSVESEAVAGNDANDDDDDDSYSDGVLGSDSEDSQHYSSDMETESSGVEVNQPQAPDGEDMISKIKNLRTLGITASDETILNMLEETKGDVSLALCALLENF